MKFKLAFGAGLLAAAASASAATYSFTLPLQPALPFVDSKLVTGPDFSDDWTFTAPAQAASTSGSVISVNISGFFNIEDLSLGLYDDNDQLLSAGPAGDGSQVVNVAVTAGESYYFRVSGKVTNATSGFYVFTADAAPLAEPGALLLTLAALGAAAVTRRPRRG